MEPGHSIDFDYVFQTCWDLSFDMGVSKNRGTPKSSILIGFSIINHPFWGTPIFGNTYIFTGETSQRFWKNSQ